MRNNQNGRMKITQTENETHLVDEYGEVTESSDCKNLFRVIQSIQNAEFPENIAAQDWVIIENSGIKEIAADLRANNDELDSLFTGFKKRLENSPKMIQDKAVKAAEQMRAKKIGAKSKKEMEEIEKEAQNIELSGLVEYKKNKEGIERNLKAINSIPTLYEVKFTNFKNQVQIFNLKKLII